MKHHRGALAVILTVLAVAAFAGLPAVVALWQDAAADRSGYAQMQSIMLELGRENVSMPIMGKLAILSGGEAIAVNPSEVSSRTEEEIFQAAQEQMSVYEDAGIFRWFAVSNCSAQLNLAIDPEDASNYLVYWTVSYNGDEKSTRGLVLDMDDETGKILRIHYDVFESYSMDGVWERNGAMMEQFTAIYFAQLDLQEAAQYARTAGNGYAYYDRDGGVSSAVYSFGDVTYGEVNLEFYVEGAGGFYLFFPE